MLLISIAILAISIKLILKIPDYKNDKNCSKEDLFIDLKELN